MVTRWEERGWNKEDALMPSDSEVIATTPRFGRSGLERDSRRRSSRRRECGELDEERNRRE